MIWLYIAAGGALGAVSRYGVNVWLFPVFEQRFPLATFVVNVVGSALMGVAYVLLIERGSFHPELRHLIMTGFLGALTTFSAFSMDTVALMRNGDMVTGAAYVLLSVCTCIIATLLAIKITAHYL